MKINSDNEISNMNISFEVTIKKNQKTKRSPGQYDSEVRALAGALKSPRLDF